MPRYTITPWRHQTDLLAVRTQLYDLTSPAHPSTSPFPRRHAVDRVLAWKLRGNLPHAVESTALLVDAILHHHHSTSAHQSSFAIRAVYAAAFSRFVTGFCDIGRAREGTLNPSSMLEIARQIGMPVHFVGLRHEATHEEVPALGRLVAATGEALGWLWQAYWSRLDEGEVGQRGDHGDGVRWKDEARGLLRSYRGVRREAFKLGKHNSAQHQADIDDFATKCGEICDYNGGENVHALVEVLVDERLLLPSNRGLGTSMNPAFTLWDALLDRVITSYPEFLQTVANAILNTLITGSASRLADERQDAEQEGLYLWLQHLFARYERGSIDAYRSMSAELMKQCCLHPGFWTRKLGKDALAAADNDFVDAWEDLFKASALPDVGEMILEVESDALGPAGEDGLDSQDQMDVDVVVARRKSQAESSAGGGWRRAVIAPNVPIGVVG